MGTSMGPAAARLYTARKRQNGLYMCSCAQEKLTHSLSVSTPVSSRHRGRKNRGGESKGEDGSERSLHLVGVWCEEFLTMEVDWYVRMRMEIHQRRGLQRPLIHTARELLLLLLLPSDLVEAAILDVNRALR
jgi:hypothetical protein